MNTKKLINWYKQNARDLPWRHTKEPYKIWLSEIILQQTQVKQGLDYYLKFIEKYPTIRDFAKADEQEILKLWQGLGYYSRARNMHFTANIITKEFKGKFPDNYKELLKLKGVGEYTAAAIASFCFNQPVGVVDGNVSRVLSRLYGIKLPINTTQGKKYFQNLVNNLVDKNEPDLFNQAMMEYGATLCTPKNPKCEKCIFVDKCVAFLTGDIDKFPVKINKIKVKKRYLNFLLIQNNDYLIVEKRQKKDIWKNLYQLPLIESKKDLKNMTLKQLDNISKKYKIAIKSEVYLLTETKHQLTHQSLKIKFWKIIIKEKNKHFIPKNELKNYPFPTPIINFLDNYI